MHLVYGCAALYMMMTLTNWYEPEAIQPKRYLVKFGEITHELSICSLSWLRLTTFDFFYFQHQVSPADHNYVLKGILWSENTRHVYGFSHFYFLFFRSSIVFYGTDNG